jgi:hypothetical protein
MNLNCPHCGNALDKVITDPLSDWGGVSKWICMNDDCGYFKTSWNVMQVQGVPMGYRYCCDEDSNGCPILVLNHYTYKDRVVDYEQEWKDQQLPTKDNDKDFDIKERLDKIERKLDQIIFFFKDNPNLLR